MEQQTTESQQSLPTKTCKKCGQDPEYQAKVGAIRKKRWQDPEYRAKMRAARARRHNKRE